MPLLAGERESLKDRLLRLRSTASWAAREAKGVFGSELEQVVLKATRPDENEVKQKHLEVLLRTTYIMPKEFKVYSIIGRKLWGKMADTDWRTVVKAVYIMHRFAAEGNPVPEHSLKGAVRELRDKQDSRRKAKFFDVATICHVKPRKWTGENIKQYAAFLKDYARFVLLRISNLGPSFVELLDNYTMLVGTAESLPTVKALIDAGLQCTLEEDQECPLTVAAVLQVAQDLHGVLEVCAAQLDFLSREPGVLLEYGQQMEQWYSLLASRSKQVLRFLERCNAIPQAKDKPAPQALIGTTYVLNRRNEAMRLAVDAAHRQAPGGGGEAEPGPMAHGAEEAASGSADLAVPSPVASEPRQVNAGVPRRVAGPQPHMLESSEYSEESE